MVDRISQLFPPASGIECYDTRKIRQRGSVDLADVNAFPWTATITFTIDGIERQHMTDFHPSKRAAKYALIAELTRIADEYVVWLNKYFLFLC